MNDEIGKQLNQKESVDDDLEINPDSDVVGAFTDINCPDHNH